MIKVSVMYPNTPGARFDHKYYKDKHMPMVKSKMGDACTHYTVDRGLAGGAPGAPAIYVGMCHIFCSRPVSVPTRRRSWRTSPTTRISRRSFKSAKWLLRDGLSRAGRTLHSVECIARATDL